LKREKFQISLRLAKRGVRQPLFSISLENDKIPLFMKAKKIIVWGVIVVVLGAIVGGYFVFSKSGESTTVMAQVEKGTLVQTVEANGVLESLDKADLSFGSSGIVSLMLVEVGNEVRAGDLLAALDTDELQAQANYYAYATTIAQANLDKTIAGSTTETIALYEAKVASAETSLAVAKTDLANEKLNNVEDLSEAYDDLIQVLKDGVIEARSSLSEADNVLGIDNSMANDDYQDVLGANDWGSLQLAKYNYPLAKSARDQAESAVFALTGTSEDSVIEAAATLTKDALAKTAATLLYVRRTLDGTNIDTVVFPSAELLALEGTIDAERASVETKQTALTTQEQVVAQLKISNQDEIDTAEGLVEKYEDVLAEAKATLAQTKAGPRNVDLAPLQAALSQAEANYAAALARLNDAQIISPINGKVTMAEIGVGERITALSPAITIQSTAKQFQVTADISESDISRVSVDDTVEVTFDAFGDDQIFTGRVNKIDPAEKNIGGVIYYEATVYLNEPAAGIELKPGMTADLTILTENVENILLITQRAVLEKTDGTKYVRLPQGDSFEERTVEVGLRGDGGFWQVLSGLEDGDMVIVSVREQ
jgi:HlyD family secretion protein